MDLKDKMLQKQSHGKQEMDSFELQLRGQRISDAEEINQDHTLDFQWLGPDEGARRAKDDALDQKRREQESRAQMMAKRSAPKAEPARQLVEVVVKHANEDMKSQVSVEVAANGTILDLRRAVMAKLGESKLTEVKIVKKQGMSFSTLGDAESIGTTRQFLSTGRKLEVPTGPLTISVVIDAEAELENSFEVARGSKIALIKDKIAADDPTGAIKAADFGLGIAKASGTVMALPDFTVLTEQHLRLQVTDPAPAEAPVSLAKPKEVPAVAIWKVVGGAQQGGILVREGRETKSEQLPSRLSTGAIVEELALVESRLHYRTITGDGPKEGWVSLTVSGKELLKRHPATGPDAFTFDRAMKLQEEMLVGFGKPEIQQQLKALKAACKNDAEFGVRKMEVLAHVQWPLIAKYGFEGKESGVPAMMAAYNPHFGHPKAQANLEAINKLIT